MFFCGLLYLDLDEDVTVLKSENQAFFFLTIFSFYPGKIA